MISLFVSTPQTNLHSQIPAFTTQLIRRLEQYALRLLGDEASAQDVVQSTLEVLMNGKTEFRGESTYMTYTIGILRHKIGDVLRERNRFDQLIHEDDDEGRAVRFGTQDFLADAFTGPEDSAHSVRLGNAIQVSLNDISSRGRQAFLMREQHGMCGAQISEQLGISVGNTWVLLCRVRNQLKVSLIKQGYGKEWSGAFHA
jgi:RNA polymerase sigma-70 factor (ECF subfamily)